MSKERGVPTYTLVSQIAELQKREQSLDYLLSRSCPGNRAEAQQELAATRMLRQAAEENLEALRFTAGGTAT